MGAAIFNGFQSVICKLLQLYCSQQLHQRDEKAFDSSHQKSSIADYKASYKKGYGIFMADVHMTSSKKQLLMQLNLMISVLIVSLYNHIGSNFVLGFIIGF